MSMYDVMIGKSPLSSILLKAIEIDPRSIPRFRDCYLLPDGKHIVVFTRTGGGNREGFEKGIKRLTDHPLYSHDEDAENDSTYAYFYFNIPEELKDDFAKLAELGFGSAPAVDRFLELIKDMDDPKKKDDPQVKNAIKQGEIIARKIVDSMNSDNSSNVVEV